MSLLVVGSVALDSIHSPAGEAPEVLGGSAVHFSIAASFFHPVRLVGVIGDDFPEPFVEVLRGRDVDLRGLERGEGKSFRWTGRYEGSMASAETLSVELNLFGTFDPKVPEAFRDSRFVFLANGSPTVQRKVLEQVDPAAFTLMDTMNLWIEIEHQGLLDVLAGVGALVINDGELRQLTGQKNLLLAGKSVLAMGPRIVIVKKGEHGALAFMGDHVFAAPAYPVTDVKDPTG
ncbi:MAG: PfkB family carbohydrate kinase, partial [Planctomycetota bacterium]